MEEVDGAFEEQAHPPHHEEAPGLEAAGEGQEGRGQVGAACEEIALDEPLDSPRTRAIRTALLLGDRRSAGGSLSSWVEALRDRIVVLSQVGKGKLDAAFTRRELDRKLVVLGERVLMLVREGSLVLPDETAALAADARDLQDRLAAQHEEITALEGGTA